MLKIEKLQFQLIRKYSTHPLAFRTFKLQNFDRKITCSDLNIVTTAAKQMFPEFQKPQHFAKETVLELYNVNLLRSFICPSRKK